MDECISRGHKCIKRRQDGPTDMEVRTLAGENFVGF